MSKQVCNSNVRSSKPVTASHVCTSKPVYSSNFNTSQPISMKYKKNYLSSVFFLSALYWEFLLLGIFINNNFHLISNNKYVFNNTSIVYNAPDTVYYNSNSFLQTNYSKVFNNLYLFKPLYIFKRTCLKVLGNFNFYTKSLFLLMFFTTFDMSLIKMVNLDLNNRSGKKKKLCCGFLSTFPRITNIYSQLQHVNYKVLSYCYKFLNCCFYIFEILLILFF